MTPGEQLSASENSGLGVLVKFAADPVVWQRRSQPLSPRPGSVSQPPRAAASGSSSSVAPAPACEPPGPRSPHNHRVTAAGGAGLRRRGRRRADPNRRGHWSYPRTHSHAHCRARATSRLASPRLATRRTSSCGSQRNTTRGSSQPGKKLNHPAKKPVHSKVRTKGKKIKNRSSGAGQGEAAEVDFLLASPGAPGGGARRRGAGRRAALLGPAAGRPSRPAAPAGSMNESAWK